jgi:hypothetical protein
VLDAEMAASLAALHTILQRICELEVDSDVENGRPGRLSALLSRKRDDADRDDDKARQVRSEAGSAVDSTP